MKHPLIKSALLIYSIYAGLVWLYCVVRVYTGNFPFSEPFIYGLPGTFLELSIFTFITSGTAGFLYLVMSEAEKL